MLSLLLFSRCAERHICKWTTSSVWKKFTLQNFPRPCVSWFISLSFSRSHNNRRVPNVEQTKIEGLYPDTLYYFWLAARSQRGEGATSPSIPVRTKQYGKIDSPRFFPHSDNLTSCQKNVCEKEKPENFEFCSLSWSIVKSYLSHHTHNETKNESLQDQISNEIYSDRENCLTNKLTMNTLKHKMCKNLLYQIQNLFKISHSEKSLSLYEQFFWR